MTNKPNPGQFKTDSKAYAIGLICCLVVASLMVSPLLAGGYTNDDSLNSLISGSLAINHKGLIDYIIFFTASILQNLGRFYPFASISPILSSFLPGIFWSKVITFMLILTDLLVFSYFIRLLTGSRVLGLLSIVLTPVLFQYRLYHDPIMGYTSLLQIIFLLLIASLVMLILYMKKQRPVYLAFSIVLYLGFILFGEISYLFILVYLLFIFYGVKRQGIKDRVRIALPYIVLIALVIIIPVGYRVMTGAQLIGDSGNDSYVANLDPSGFGITLFKQTLSALPLEYYLFDPNGIFSDRINGLFEGLTIISCTIAVLLFAIVYYLINRLSVDRDTYDPIPSENGLLIASGTLLLILPGVLISLLPKYHTEVLWGFGYIYVYISYFGLSAILIGSITILYRYLSKYSHQYLLASVTIIALLITTAGVINYDNNVKTTDLSNQYWEYPRAVMEDALRSGLLSNIPQGSALMLDSNYPWDQSSFYYMNGGFTPGSVNTNDKIRYSNTGGYSRSIFGNDSALAAPGGLYTYHFSSAQQPICYIKYYSYGHDNGYALAGMVDYLSTSDNTFYSVAGNTVYLYIRCPSGIHSADYFQQAGYVVVTAPTFGEAMHQGPTAVINEDKMQLLDSGAGWKLFKISLPDGELDLRSISVQIAPHYTYASEFFLA